MSGVKPNFTGDTSSEESDEDGFIRTDVIRKGPTKREVDIEEVEADFTAVNVEDDFTEDVSKLDRRLQRLQRLKQESSEERHVSDPEVIDPGQSEVRRQRHVRYEASDSENEDLPDDDEEEDEVERRHAALRKKLLMEDFDGLESKNERLIEYADRDHNEDEDDEEDDEEDSDDDEYESEDDTGPRLKPVFVRKQDRASLIRQREEEDRKTKEQEEEAEKLAKERHKIALKMIEVSVQQEVQQQNDDNQDISAETIAAVKTDDESEEIAYLNWKVRELQRNKRDKEEREEYEMFFFSYIFRDLYYWILYFF